MANFAVNISKLFPTDYMKDFAEILGKLESMLLKSRKVLKLTAGE